MHIRQSCSLLVPHAHLTVNPQDKKDLVIAGDLKDLEQGIIKGK